MKLNLSKITKKLKGEIKLGKNLFTIILATAIFWVITKTLLKNNLFLPALILSMIFFLFLFFWTFNAFVNEKNPGLLVVNYITTMLILAMLFSFLQLNLEISGSGYLRYGGCDNSFVQGNFSTIVQEERSPNYYYYSVQTIFLSQNGDICPMGQWTKILSNTEMIFGLTITIIILPLLISRISKELDRKNHNKEND